jgi:hypothetical protein
MTYVLNSCNITLIVNEINGLNQFHESNQIPLKFKAQI